MTEKICIECEKGLARHWGKNFCQKCIARLLNEHFREEDKLHAEVQKVQEAT